MDKDTTKMKRTIYCALGEWFEALTVNFHASELGRWWYYVPRYQKNLSWCGVGLTLGLALSWKIHHLYVWLGW